MLKTIIFDLGNVIVPFDFRRSYKGMGDLIGMPAEEVRQRFTDANLIVPYETGDLDNGEFLTKVGDALGRRIELDTFSKVWSSIFLPEANFAPSFIDALRKNYRTLILSNTNDLHWNMLRTTYPVLSHFDDHVLSYRVRAMKPSPKIYQAAIGMAGCRPEECFFTDDVPAYVEAAHGQGIHAVQFESADQIMSELRARGVDW